MKCLKSFIMIMFLLAPVLVVAEIVYPGFKQCEELRSEFIKSLNPCLQTEADDAVLEKFPVCMKSFRYHARAVRDDSSLLNYMFKATPLLHYVVSKGGVKSINAVLDGGYDVNKKNNCLSLIPKEFNYSCYGHTALHQAAPGFDGILKAEQLLDRAADVNALNGNGATPLHVTARFYNTNMIKLLYDRGAQLEVRDVYGNTPTHNAALSHNPRMIQALHDHGADINAVNGFSGDTPLHAAIGNCMFQATADCGSTCRAVQALIDMKANINQRNNKGVTPIKQALQFTFFQNYHLKPLHESILILGKSGADISDLTQEEKKQLDAIMQEAASK